MDDGFPPFPEPERLTLLLGAGASVSAPANLPLFAQLRARLLDDLRIPNELRDLASRLSPEVFMQVLSDGGLPLVSWLRDALGRAEPNAIHFSAASLLRRGAVVWTVNVDELIEAAAGDWIRDRTAVWGRRWNSPSDLATARLLKPHGTLSEGELLFRSAQVVRPLAERWRARLERDISERHVVVLGYRGADVDIRVVLDGLLCEAERVDWFEFTGQHDEVAARLPATMSAGILHARPAPSEEANPSVAFLSWLIAGTRYGAELEPGLVALAGTGGGRAVPPIPGEFPLAAAELLSRIGARDAARGRFGEALRRGSVRPRLRALKELIRLAAWRDERWLRPIRRAAVLSPVVFPGRAWLRRVNMTLLTNSGRHDLVLELTEVPSRARRVKPSTLSVRAAALRYEGSMEEARATAARALTLAQEQGDPDSVAFAAFELSIASAWSGAISDAESALALFFDGYDALASVRWIGWARFQRACVRIHNEDGLGALLDLADARTLFEADNLPIGVADTLIVQLTASRMLRDSNLFDATLASLESIRPSVPDWTAVTSAAISLEVAEHARMRGDPHRAASIYREVVDARQGLHTITALVGLGEIEREAGQAHPPSTLAALPLASKRGLRLLQVHAFVTLALADPMGASGHIASIRELGVIIPRFRPIVVDGVFPDSRNELFIP